MQDRDLTGQTALEAAAVAERLDAEVGDADAIRVMPMWGVAAAAAEPRLQKLDPPDRPAAAHPIGARSFKTFASRPA
jgi:hypothetical protein